MAGMMCDCPLLLCSKLLKRPRRKVRSTRTRAAEMRTTTGDAAWRSVAADVPIDPGGLQHPKGGHGYTGCADAVVAVRVWGMMVLRCGCRCG